MNTFFKYKLTTNGQKWPLKLLHCLSISLKLPIFASLCLVVSLEPLERQLNRNRKVVLIPAFCCKHFSHFEFVTWSMWAPESSTGGFSRATDSKPYDHHVINPRSLIFLQQLQSMQLLKFAFNVDQSDPIWTGSK